MFAHPSDMLSHMILKSIKNARILFSQITLKDIFTMLKFATGHFIHTSVNGRVTSPFRESFVYAKFLREVFRGNKPLAKISGFAVP